MTAAKTCDDQRPVVAQYCPEHWPSLVQPSFVAEMDVRELAVAVFQLHGERSADLRRAAADLRLFEFEALREVDPHAVLGARYDVADRLALRRDHARDLQPRDAPVHIDLEVDFPVQAAAALSGLIALNTHHMVAMSSVSWPDRIFTKRFPLSCVGALRRSPTCIVPRPSWIAPGQMPIVTARRPSSFTSPK